MGFTPQQTIYNLTFQGTPLDGLEVRMSCCTIKENAEMIKAAVGEEGDDNKITTDTIRENDRVIEIFLNHLISWNLEDMAGQAVPATREGMDTQERSLVAQLMGAWQVAMVNVPNLSPPGSSSGETSAEASLGLGNSSTNLGS